MARDAPIGRINRLFSAFVGRVRKRLYVRVEVGVEPVARGAAHERFQVLVLLRLRLVDVVKENENRGDAEMSHLREMFVGEYVVAVSGVRHAHVEDCLASLDAFLQERPAPQVHEVLEMGERLQRGAFAPARDDNVLADFDAACARA